MLKSIEKGKAWLSGKWPARPTRWAAACACVALFVPGAADAALAQLSGGSGYSADLSHNVAIRHQQLICDPTLGPGSASVTYDPAVVSLFSVFNEAGYDTTNEYVGVLVGGVKEIEAAATYFGSGSKAQEWGYVQVAWYGPSSAPPMVDVEGGTPTTTGLTQDQSAGPAGANTFGLEFTYLPATNNVNAKYTIYAEETGYPIYDGSGTFTPDYVTEEDAPGTEITNVAPASVMSALPEPSMGLFLFSVIAVLASRRGLRLKGRCVAATPHGSAS
jgi:hypothetical protein